MRYKVLVVEDDKDLQAGIRKILLEEGYSVETASTGFEALKRVEKSLPNIILLDLVLPDIAGESVCQQLKKDYSDLPIIMVTAKNETSNLVEGFKVGADDYIAKPFDAEELLARLKTRLGKDKKTSSILKIDKLTLDRKKVEVKREKKKIKLTQQEFNLLEYLMINKNIVVSREMILTQVWGFDSEVETRVVDVYIGYLRKKIDKPFKKKLIHSIVGFGYVIKG